MRSVLGSVRLGVIVMSDIVGAVWSLFTSDICLSALAAAVVPACGGLALRLFLRRF